MSERSQSESHCGSRCTTFQNPAQTPGLGESLVSGVISEPFWLSVLVLLGIVGVFYFARRVIKQFKEKIRQRGSDILSQRGWPTECCDRKKMCYLLCVPQEVQERASGEQFTIPPTKCDMVIIDSGLNKAEWDKAKRASKSKTLSQAVHDAAVFSVNMELAMVTGVGDLNRLCQVEPETQTEWKRRASLYW